MSRPAKGRTFVNSRARTRDELLHQLRDQAAALESSCEGYDAGNEWEAPRIATAVYNLVNDGRSNSVSILSQLCIRNKIKYISYGHEKDPESILTHTPLCLINMIIGDGASDTYARFHPAFDLMQKFPRSMNFSDWWAEPIYENAKGKVLSRMNLTFSLRSKDGGAHYDQSIPVGEYLELKECLVHGTISESGIIFHLPGYNHPETENSPITLKSAQNAHSATMRHIAFELQQSLISQIESLI